MDEAVGNLFTRNNIIPMRTPNTKIHYLSHCHKVKGPKPQSITPGRALYVASYANENNSRGTLVWRRNLWNSVLGEQKHLLKIGFFNNFFQHKTFMGKIRIFRKGLRLRLYKSKRFLWKINMGRQKKDVWRAVVQVWEQVPENGLFSRKLEGRI